MNLFLLRNYRNCTKLGLTLVLSSFLGSSNASTPVDSHSTNPIYSIDVTYSNGSIKNENNEAVVGATIRNLTNKAVTGSKLDGSFQIEANPGDVLEISSLGYVTQRVTFNNSPIDIILLKEESAIEEVVVTAMGIKQQKRKIGYATQEVKTEVLDQSKTMNIGNALSGQVAGLNVTNPTGIFQKPNFSLRGKKPIIVIDGIVVETDFFDVPSENIANINVLKGTAASTLYGSRGKDGAILITTKSAKSENLEVNFTTTNMVTAGFTVFPETQNEYGSGSNGMYEFWDGADGGISDGDMTWGPKLDAGIKVPQWNSPIRNKKTGEIIPWWGDVRGTIYDDRALYERVPTDFVSHNNLKDFLRMGFVNDNNVSLAYKGEKAAVFFTGKYAIQQGQVPNSQLQSGGATLNTSYMFNPSLKLDVNLSYNKVYSPNYPRYGYGPKNHMYTILLWMGNDVNGKELSEHLYIPGQEGFRQANYNYAWYNNPYFAAEELNQQHNRDVLHGQSTLNWQISPKFSLQGRASARQNMTFEDMQSPKSYMNYGDSRNGDYKVWNNKRLDFDADVLATYQENFGENFGININAGSSTYQRKFNNFYSATDGLIVPQLYALGNTQGPSTSTSFLSEKVIRSVYGSVSFDILRSTYLNFSARNDWSSTLPQGQNSYFYPAVSLSSVLSDYFKLPAGIDYLKVYSSLAQVSSDLDPYSTYLTYAKSLTYGATPSVSYPETLANPNINPERSTSFEAGFALSFLNNKVSAEATYYNVGDEFQIQNLPTSAASAFNYKKSNVIDYRTHGVEVMLNINPIKRENFSWDFGVNWSRQIKKVENIEGAKKFGELKVGDRADSFYATVWQKSADGQVILNPNTRMPIPDSYAKNIGHLEPNWRFGFQNRFNIHDVTVNLDIDGSIGGVINSITHEKMWWGGKHPSSTQYREAEYSAGKYVYVPEGVIITGGELKRDVDGNVISDTRQYEKNTQAVSWQTWSQIYPYRARVTEDENKFFANVFDRSFVKLRRLSVGYDINKFIKTDKVKAINASVFGYNLLMWQNIPFLDPDFGDDNNLQDPSSRYIGVSLNFKF
ncbi:SusC/RagA family TonB-linked outer membrane protein [Sphingobacterium sp. BN32]|uniref:SusC/RagA family TonB-linked outer membrane protein n=1 Tax=Sphingobacterium sp. BN32 TaxID=3058432 RepID=UPI00265CA4F2|nr:SusC/RagA family TonB-linked outer membrane protein [Sphingobacterium sp. BN32]WKK58248.1 SusC/RagA family TonB-linked outer membrane protein [Sphingobacterium sp. BN32]